MARYQKYKPAPTLDPYILFYYHISVDAGESFQEERILPDACSDIIFFLNEKPHFAANADFSVDLGKPYMLGSMTSFFDASLAPSSEIIGVRFKPLGLYALLQISSKDSTDKLISLSRSDLIFSSRRITVQSVEDCLSKHAGNGSMIHLIDLLFKSGGEISVSELAAKSFYTERSLQRLFTNSMGIAPKEICKQLRFQSAVREILSGQNKSFVSIAYETGYHDHPHLLKDVRHYSGYAPNQLIRFLSDFYQN